jgi:hypothetical protein
MAHLGHPIVRGSMCFIKCSLYGCPGEEEVRHARPSTERNTVTTRLVLSTYRTTVAYFMISPKYLHGHLIYVSLRTVSTSTSLKTNPATEITAAFHYSKRLDRENA